MYSSRDGHVGPVLVLVLMQSVVFASLNTQKKTETLAKEIVSSMEVPWIKGIQSAISYSESPCGKEIAALLEAIDAREMWALEMLDASSKIQSGILQGNVMDMGMYDQCVRVDGEHNGVKVQGKHCMVTLAFETLNLMSSVCLPSSCNETEAIEIVSTVTKNLLGNSSLEIEFEANTAKCMRIGSKDFTLVEILTIAFFTTVGAFIIFCTICDLVKRSWPEKTSVGTLTTLAKFSLCTNAPVIFSTRVKPGTMPAVNGIRFLSTCWIVILHHYSMSVISPLVNASEFTRWKNSWNGTIVQAATFATDNFFMVSGFLMSYSFFKSMRSAGGKFNVPMMYLHRYTRLTPGLAVVMLFVAVLYNRIGNGLLWESTSHFVATSCKETWWANLLYVQNFQYSSDICLLQTWFLAADMQLFWISPIILYPLHRWPKYGLRVLSLFLLISVVTPMLVVGLNGYKIISDFAHVSFDNYHIRSYTRAFPYLIGILLGYEIATEKRRLTQMTVAVNWVVASALMILCCLLLRYLTNSAIKDDYIFNTICAGLFHPSWSVAMGWIIYACSQGYGGVVAKFFSLPIFLPLSRLSYGIYLVHIVIIVWRARSSTISVAFSDTETLISWFGVMVVSIAVSGVISLLFEYPVMTLERILKNRPRQRERATPAEKDDPVLEVLGMKRTKESKPQN